MDSASEVKGDMNITPEVEAQQDEEPTMKDLLIMMQFQLQEQKKDRELIKQLGDGDAKFEEYERGAKLKTSSMKVKEPPIFQGEANSDVNRWLELIEDFMSCFSENEVMKVQKVMLYLGEGPRIFVKTAEQEARKEGRPFLWKDVKQTLLECFLPTITEEIARMRLAVLKQTGSVWEYTAEFQNLTDISLIQIQQIGLIDIRRN